MDLALTFSDPPWILRYPLSPFQNHFIPSSREGLKQYLQRLKTLAQQIYIQLEDWQFDPLHKLICSQARD